MTDDLDLDARTLQIVHAIADAGSLTAAADALGYSQPALSQHMRRAERRLGVPLVERVGRRLRLTEAGRVLARHAPTVTTALEAAAGELAQLRGLGAATVRLIGFPSASATIVPLLISHLADSAPGITLTYVEAEPPEAAEAIRADRADVALTFSYPGDRADLHGASAQGLSVADIGTDALLVALPTAHPLAGERVVDILALADENWIGGCPRCRGHLLEVCGRAGFTPRIGFETDNTAAVERLVAQGIGVATLPGLALAAFPPVPGLTARPLADGQIRTIHAITAHGSERVPAVATVLEHLRAAVAAAAPPIGETPAIGPGVEAGAN